MTHTPGPWEFGDPKDELVYIPDGDPESAFDSISIFDADGNQVAIVPIDLYLGTSVDANAHLIAAAPELLAACEAVADYLETVEQFGCPERKLMEQLEQALAHARSEGEEVEA
jgi:hypothetical protein